MYEKQPGDVGTVDPSEKEIPNDEKPVDAEYKDVSKEDDTSASGTTEEKKE